MEIRKGIILLLGTLLVLLVYGSMYIGEYMKPYFPEERKLQKIVASKDGHWRSNSYNYEFVGFSYRMDYDNAQKHFFINHPECIGDSTFGFEYITAAEVKFYGSRLVVASNIVTNLREGNSYTGKWEISGGKIVFNNPLFLSFPEKSLWAGFE